MNIDLIIVVSRYNIKNNIPVVSWYDVCYSSLHGDFLAAISQYRYYAQAVAP
jgi:hypothetical protein